MRNTKSRATLIPQPIYGVLEKAETKDSGRAVSKLPPLGHPVKGRMAFERPHIGRKQPEADRTAPVTVVAAVEERLQFLAPVVVGRKEIGLMLTRGNQVE